MSKDGTFINIFDFFQHLSNLIMEPLFITCASSQAQHKFRFFLFVSRSSAIDVILDILDSGYIWLFDFLILDILNSGC